MNDTLFHYYERELLFIRQLVNEYRGQHRQAADRLLLEANRAAADPHVERLLQSFAFVAGRVQHKLDDEFPEISTALLQALYPHYLAPIPSVGMVQFELDAARGQLPGGFTLPRHSPLQTEPAGGLRCKYRTTCPVTLWPIQLVDASFHAPPFPRGLAPPPGAGAALRLSFTCQGTMTFTELELERLRLHLHGEIQVIPPLYELLFNHALQVVFRPEGETGPPPIVLAPEACLAPVGFHLEDSLLPYAPTSRLGHRLLTELFVYPAKFWFVDVLGWDKVRRAGWRHKAEVVVFFDHTVPILEKSVNAMTFRLGCTPIVNLFSQTAESMPLAAEKADYRLVPDATHPRGLEVYSVDAVRVTQPADGTARELLPFFSVRHPQAPERPSTYWYSSRAASLAEHDAGTFVDVHLVDLDGLPLVPGGSALEVSTTCTNRDVPNELRLAGTAVSFELEAAAPLSRTRCLRPVTPPLRPKERRGRYWHLVSHFSLNPLSLANDTKGREALQEILGLYDFSDPDAGQQQLAAVTRQFIDGITEVSSQRVIGRLTGARRSSFCRGLEVALTFAEDKYPGVGVFLFASVLERFLALYVSSNSFVQLVARKSPQEEPFKRWPPRPGDLESL